MPVAYIRPKSRTERPRKTKIGTVVAYVTRDLIGLYGHYFQGQKVKGQLTGGGAYCSGLPHNLLHFACRLIALANSATNQETLLTAAPPIAPSDSLLCAYCPNPVLTQLRLAFHNHPSPLYRALGLSSSVSRIRAPRQRGSGYAIKSVCLLLYLCG